MRAHVSREVAGLREGPAAREALVGPFVVARAYVHRQVVGRRSGLAAGEALAGLLAGVRAHVLREVAGLRTDLATIVALGLRKFLRALAVFFRGADGSPISCFWPCSLLDGRAKR